jgi:hypothetical protein
MQTWKALRATFAAAAAFVAADTASRCQQSQRFRRSPLLRAFRPPGKSSNARLAPTRHSPATRDHDTLSKPYLQHSPKQGSIGLPLSSSHIHQEMPQGRMRGGGW